MKPKLQTARPPELRTHLEFNLGLEDLAFGYWFYYYASLALTPVFFRSAPAQATLVDGIIQTIFLLLTLTWVWHRHRLQRTHFSWSFPSKMVVLYLLWAGVTLLWTHADSVPVAFSYWAVAVVVIITAYLLVCCGSIERIADKSMRGAVLGALVLAVTTVATFRGGFDADRLGDLEYLHPNQLGRAMAITALCALHLAIQARSSKQRWFYGSAVLGLLATLVASVSKTSIAGFVLAAMVYIAGSKVSRRTKLAIGGAIVALMLAAAPFLIDRIETYSRGIHGDAFETLSGRTTLWSDTWDMICDQPVVGYGFYSYRDYGPQIFAMRVPMAHNEWLQLWWTYGIIGVIISVAIYAGLVKQWYRGRKLPSIAPQANLAMALLILAWVRGVTEAATIGLVYELPMVVLMSAWMALPLRAVVPVRTPVRVTTVPIPVPAGRYENSAGS